MLKLYDHPQCPFGQKTRIVLAEKDLDYQMVVVDLHRKEQLSDWFVALNPFHRVPVLVDVENEDEPTSGLVIYDSTIINEYLEDEYPEPTLLPPAGESADRARARLFEDYADNRFVPATTVLLTEQRRPEAERDVDRMRRAKAEIDATFSMLEQELSTGKDFLLGAFSIADAAFAPRLLMVVRTGAAEIGESQRALRAYVNRLAQRPSIRSVEGL